MTSKELFLFAPTIIAFNVYLYKESNFLVPFYLVGAQGSMRVGFETIDVSADSSFDELKRWTQFLLTKSLFTFRIFYLKAAKDFVHSVKNS